MADRSGPAWFSRLCGIAVVTALAAVQLAGPAGAAAPRASTQRRAAVPDRTGRPLISPVGRSWVAPRALPHSALVPIVPPDNPAANGDVDACLPGTDAACVVAINAVRSSQEGLGELVLPSNWSSLSVPEQMFVIANLERVSRGEPPIPSLVDSQNSAIQTAITDDADPIPVDPQGGWAANWAGGDGLTVLAADALWMYYDGPGGDNEDCAAAGDPGCWGHRDDILANASYIGADPQEMDAGEGNDASGVSSYAELFMTWSGDTPIFQWSSELPDLSPLGIGDQSLPSGAVGTAYSAGLEPIMGSAPFTWSVSGGSLPTGLTLDPSSGSISGTPSAAGTADFEVTLTDTNADTVTADLTITVVAEGAYTALAPTRICDTRPGDPSGLTDAAAACDGKTLSPGAPLDVAAMANFGVPIDATAVVVNVTAVGPTGSGYLTIYPSSAPVPTASTLNFVAGYPVANLAEVGLGTGGAFDVVANTTTDVVIDLEGYVAPATGDGGLYQALGAPARICDTRPGNPSGLTGGADQCDGAGDAGETLAPGTPLGVRVDGVGGVPASGVSAVVLNVTAAGPAAQGYLSAYPAGGTAPTASNVNFHAGQAAEPNRVIVPVDAAGQIDLAANVSVNAIVDVSGWFSSSGDTGSAFEPVSAPVRICDTRPGNPSGLSGPAAQCADQTLGASQTLTVNVSGLAGIPSGATAAVLNVTAVAPTSQTYLTVYPGPGQPDSSDLNPAAGAVEANLVVATLSASGTVTIFNHSGSVNVVVDVAGWYTS